MNPIELSIFASRMDAICEEMGAVLKRAAFSPNIKDRLDFSCAIFDAQGELCAQAAHIPVHLGSMAYAMRDIVSRYGWQPDDMMVVNDPYLGGTHLPDITLIAPLFRHGEIVAFVANRAHHADIGATTPGSMPIASSLEQEGMIIPPTLLIQNGQLQQQMLEGFVQQTANPRESRGDFVAQISANQTGTRRLAELVAGLRSSNFAQALKALNQYAARLAQQSLADIPSGCYRFTDYMDDDGQGHTDLPIQVAITIGDEAIEVDFSGTAAQTPGNINCPVSVAAAGVYYVFRCLMPAHTPACAGSFAHIRIAAPQGSLVNARRPAAVAAGNVETSSRIVDAVMGALAQAIPERMAAASHGTMNNLAMGSRTAGEGWSYYETIGGGMGAGAHGGGLSALQTHLTNTLNTPLESLEAHYPLRIRRYAIRSHSGGEGRRRGGDGVIREYELLKPTTVTLLTERRRHRPWGIAGGGDGQAGENRLNGKLLPAKVSFQAKPGDVLTIATPGGGGWGQQQKQE